MPRPTKVCLAVGGAVALSIYAGAIALIHCWAPLNWVVISGVSSLGLLTGVLVAFFVQEVEDWDRKALSFSVAALAASGILGLLHFAAKDNNDAVWFYPIGLVVGFIIGTVWDWQHENRKKKKG